jgi:hypothetical protein
MKKGIMGLTNETKIIIYIYVYFFRLHPAAYGNADILAFRL